MTTFPLTPPAALLASEVRFTSKTVVAASRSPFTGGEQVYVHQGQWWEMDITVLPGPRQTIEDVIAFILELNGMEGTFTFSPPGGGSPLGTGSGSPIVATASQSGQSLLTNGWAASASAVLRPGDYLSIISGTNPQPRLYKNLRTVDTLSGGVASLSLFPRIRLPAPASGAAITISSAQGIWRLSSNEMPWDISGGLQYGMTIACVEALNP